jgi:ubiquinone/menaquinone biosynthesis C-methylase UbiE
MSSLAVRRKAQPNGAAVETGTPQLKGMVRDFWQAHPCEAQFATAEVGSRAFYEQVERYRYAVHPHLPHAAGFAKAKGLRVLEIGSGLGTDGAHFAAAGAVYTGVDLTRTASALTRRRFELFKLPGSFAVADAENLPFPDNYFDLVYSHGVLHHTPNTQRAINEAYRVLRPGGRAVVMLYYRNSFNYRINIRVIRRLRAHLLRSQMGVKLAHRLLGETFEQLHAHAGHMKRDPRASFRPDTFLSRHTDGPDCPLARVYSREEASALFQAFSEVRFAVHFWNRRWIPVVGKILSARLESSLSSRWGWHLWIYATKPK